MTNSEVKLNIKAEQFHLKSEFWIFQVEVWVRSNKKNKFLFSFFEDLLKKFEEELKKHLNVETTHQFQNPFSNFFYGKVEFLISDKDYNEDKKEKFLEIVNFYFYNVKALLNHYKRFKKDMKTRKDLKKRVNGTKHKNENIPVIRLKNVKIINNEDELSEEEKREIEEMREFLKKFIDIPIHFTIPEEDNEPF
ncbi:MAG: hypothetical protein ABIL76_01055 [candidate division WOR-3 bacterium]